MGNLQTTSCLSDPMVFADWVNRVAAINEQYSEFIRDSADVLAISHPEAAYALYQAADGANKTSYALRTSMPIKVVLPIPYKWHRWLRISMEILRVLW